MSIESLAGIADDLDGIARDGSCKLRDANYLRSAADSLRRLAIELACKGTGEKTAEPVADTQLAQGEPAVTVATTNLPGGFGPTKSLEAEVADLKRRVARLEGIELCTVAEPSSPGDKLREQIREERKVRQSDGFRQIDTARRKPA